MIDDDDCVEDWDEGADEGCIRSLFSSSDGWTSMQEALDHDLQCFGFDLVGLRKELELDTFGTLRLINYVRGRVASEGPEAGSEPAAMKDLAKDILSALRSGSVDLEAEELMRPVLEDDALLMGVDRLGVEDSEDEGEGGVEVADVEVVVEAESLKKEVEALKAQLLHARQLVGRMAGDVDEDCKQDNDTYYFNSYVHHNIHEVMLRDTVRTGGYEAAILGNPHLFAGKVVLDVGCGTGVLSMFAAKAGARQASDHQLNRLGRNSIIDTAERLIKANGYSDQIMLMRGRIEDLKLPVDVIISEWMGYALFYETMLPSVLLARDRYLVKGGSVMPDACSLFIEGMHDSDHRLGWWDDVHGLDYSLMRPEVAEAQVEVLDPASISTSRCMLKDFNLLTTEDADLDFEVPFELTAQRQGPVNGLVLSFDIGFEQHGCSKSVHTSFSTGVQSEPTHWKQALIWLEPSQCPTLEAGDKMTGVVALTRNELNPRELDITVSWQSSSTASGTTQECKGRQCYKVA
ncbi:unnamed protein product [Chrysoparadoxa australica]